MSDVEKILKGSVETTILGIITLITGYYLDGIILMVLVCAAMIVAIAEIVVTRIEITPMNGIFYSFYLAELTMLASATIVVIDGSVGGKSLILIIMSIVAADIGAYLFQSLGITKCKWLARIFNIDRAYFRYLGAFLFSVCVACMVGIAFNLEVNLATIIFIATAWFIDAIGDLISALYMEGYEISASNEILKQLPVVGWVEILFQPRGGYMGCFDTIAPAIIFYAVLQQICAS